MMAPRLPAEDLLEILNNHQKETPLSIPHRTLHSGNHLNKHIKQPIFIAFVAMVSGCSVTSEESMTFPELEITFKSGENTLKGLLFTPENSNGKAITIIGPVAFVKEQAPILYARSLARQGFTVVVFDPTSHGESEGSPRRFESGIQKTKDIQASIDFYNRKTKTMRYMALAFARASTG